MKTTSLIFGALFFLTSAFVLNHLVAPYKVDTDKSVITWTAYKVGGMHTGTVKIKEGSLDINKGTLTGGKIVVDMTSMDVTDLEKGSKGYISLLNHLKSQDFFGIDASVGRGGEVPDANAKVFTTAELVITKAKKTGKQATSDKALEYIVDANLTVKGVTKPVQFKAFVKAEGDKIMARTVKGDFSNIAADNEANDKSIKENGFFSFKRLDYDIKYGSIIGDKAIYNNVFLEIYVEAGK